MIDTIIIGAGQAGLATAYYLKKKGIDPLIVDDQEGPGAAWRHVWDSMTLFTVNEFSNLPGMPMPHYEGFPSADHVIAYFKKYEQRYGFTIKRPVRVHEVAHTSGGFTVGTDAGDYRARTVVAATGTWSSPFIPHYPGSFSGKQWHSANYPGVDPFRNSTVAVVGGANSGAQIAAELTGVADVTWYTREQPRWMPDDVDGRELFKRSSARALAILRGEEDPGADSDLGDIVMLPAVKEARDSGALTATPMFTSLDEVDADHLIWCTGFRPALSPVRGLLNDREPTVPGLFLVGYGDWLGPGSATISGVSPFARTVANEVATLLA